MCPLALSRCDHQTMRRASWQARVLAVLLLLGLNGDLGGAPRGPHARQLAEECDAMIELAVKRPYGWAWTEKLDRDPKDRRPAVSLAPDGTAAAGLVLLWAGLLLDEPRYVEAATHVARTMVTCQTGNGNILSNPTFAASPGGREPTALVPPRAATSAGLALLLAVIGADPVKDDMFRRAAIRSASWLIKQQAHDGGWPSGAPEIAGADLPQRLIRLDTEDYRNCTFALLLAGDVIEDKPARKAARASIKKLLSLQLGGPGELARVWSALYRMDGSLVESVQSFPADADALASRRAIETLLASALLERDEDQRIASKEAAAALAQLRGDDGLWARLTPLHGQSPSPVPSLFHPPATLAVNDPTLRDEFGIPALLATIELLHRRGPEQFASELSRGATLQERLACAICGLDDEPLASDWPQTAEEVAGYLRRLERRRTVQPDAASNLLNQRVARLYALLLRARLEAAFAESAQR